MSYNESDIVCKLIVPQLKVVVVDENEADSDESDEENSVVNSINGIALHSRTYARLYLTHWLRYDSSSDTWEPSANLCRMLNKVQEFEIILLNHLLLKFYSSQETTTAVELFWMDTLQRNSIPRQLQSEIQEPTEEIPSQKELLANMVGIFPKPLEIDLTDGVPFRRNEELQQDFGEALDINVGHDEIQVVDMELQEDLNVSPDNLKLKVKKRTKKVSKRKEILKEFCCPACDKTYATQKNLLNHVKKVHHVRATTSRRRACTSKSKLNLDLACSACEIYFEDPIFLNAHFASCNVFQIIKKKIKETTNISDGQTQTENNTDDSHRSETQVIQVLRNESVNLSNEIETESRNEKFSSHTDTENFNNKIETANRIMKRTETFNEIETNGILNNEPEIFNNEIETDRILNDDTETFNNEIVTEEKTGGNTGTISNVILTEFGTTKDDIKTAKMIVKQAKTGNYDLTNVTESGNVAVTREHESEKSQINGFWCKHCKKCFSTNHNLIRHKLMKHTTQKLEKACCPRCKRVFARVQRKNSFWQEHMQTNKGVSWFVEAVTTCNWNFPRSSSVILTLNCRHWLHI